MFYKVNLISALYLISFVQANVDNPPKVVSIDYNSNLNCGLCIYGGYEYCVKQREYLNVSMYPTDTQAVCVNNPTAP